MTTTEPSIADKHRILADLYTVQGLGEYISRLNIERRWESRFTVYGSDAATEGGALLVAHDLWFKYGTPVVTAEVMSDSTLTPSGSVHVHVAGHYQGVEVVAVAVITDVDAIAKIQDLPADRALLETLAGYTAPLPPSPAQVRDEIWASLGEPVTVRHDSARGIDPYMADYCEHDLIESQCRQCTTFLGESDSGPTVTAPASWQDIVTASKQRGPSWEAMQAEDDASDDGSDTPAGVAR